MAHRRKTRRRRGRPYNPNARRHQTTRAGRRGEVDRGSERLRSNKRLLTGREDLPLDPAGVLLGRELIDHQQYSTLALVTDWLQREARARGGKDGSVRNRRLSKDFETSITSAATWIYIASTQLLIRRLVESWYNLCDSDSDTKVRQRK